MATKDEALTSAPGGFAADLASLPSFFIDPESAAKRIHGKWFWIAPFLIASIVGIAVGMYLMPTILHVTAMAPIPDGTTAEQHEKGLAYAAIGIKVFVFLSPLFTAVLWLVEAALLLGLAMVLGVSARFGALFNLAAGCSLIPTLAGIARAAIIHFKGDVSTAAELNPAMGLDIFLPEGSNKFLVAAAGYFSLFQFWWLVMMALIFAAAFRVSKGKGFAAVVPLWILGLLASTALAVFQK